MSPLQEGPVGPFPDGADRDEYDRLRRRVLWTMPTGLFVIGSRAGDRRNLMTANLVNYAFPSAAELPSFDVVEMETPTPINALGAKGIGESGTIGATPAVQNAVVDALAPFGVRHVDMPANGERVWRALQDANSGSDPTV